MPLITTCCAQDAKGAIAIGLKFSDAGNWAQAQVRRHSAEACALSCIGLMCRLQLQVIVADAHLQGAPTPWRELELDVAAALSARPGAVWRASATEEALVATACAVCSC